eukprot:14648471-Heterocapsa_arctica.AAC.1
MGQSTSLKRKKATAAGVTYEDWYGNDQADEQAKAGAEKHGYTNGQNFSIEQKVRLVGRAQHHMMKTYIKYIKKNPLVKEDAENTKRYKAPKLEQLGDPPSCPNNWDTMLTFPEIMNAVLAVEGIPKPSILKQQSM